MLRHAQAQLAARTQAPEGAQYLRSLEISDARRRRGATRAPWRGCSAASISASDGAGTAAWTASVAFSLNTPPGSPDASRAISPPGGSGVSRVIPAAARAAEFTHSRWPSLLLSAAGRSPVTASRSLRCGQRCTAQSFWFQPRPTIQPPPASERARAAIRSTQSASDLSAPEIDAVEGKAKAEEVDVCIDEARNNTTCAQIYGVG